MSAFVAMLERGRGAGIVHARVAYQALGHAAMWRDRGARDAMRQNALEARREARLVRHILETEAETVSYRLWFERLLKLSGSQL